MRSVTRRSSVSRGGEEIPALHLKGVVTASMGVAELTPDDPRDPESALVMLRRADEAMYRAKDAGKDGVVISRQENRGFSHLASEVGES